MRRFSLAIAIAVLMVMAIPAVAADLHPDHVGTSCPEGYVGNWHFVNPQTEEAEEAGTITAIFDGDTVVVQTADKVNRNNQHFNVTGVGMVLTGASTDLPGKLVLSDFWCEEVKKPKS